jgi:hypothetical protein
MSLQIEDFLLRLELLQLRRVLGVGSLGCFTCASQQKVLSCCAAFSCLNGLIDMFALLNKRHVHTRMCERAEGAYDGCGENEQRAGPVRRSEASGEETNVDRWRRAHGDGER